MQFQKRRKNWLSYDEKQVENLINFIDTLFGNMYFISFRGG